METPYGKTINNHPDVIDILQVIFRDLGIDAESSSYEINEPGGLPHNKTARYMIEIVSFTYFSNRVFSGDPACFRRRALAGKAVKRRRVTNHNSGVLILEAVRSFK